MSIQDCQLVCRNGQLCCTPQTICIKDCAWTVTVRGGPFTVLQYPTGNTNEGTVVYDVTPVDGNLTIAEPGTYTVDLDCDALDGTPCPDPTTAPYVCWEENCINGLLELQILEKLCAIEVGGGVDFGPLIATITAQFDALCAKVEANGATLTAIAAALAAIDAQLTAILAAINEGFDALCGKLDAILAAIIAMQAALIAELGVAIGILNNIATELTDQGLSLDAILACLESDKKTQAAILDCLKDLKDVPAGDIATCCTGGAVPGVTDFCFNVPNSLLSGSDANCTYNVGGTDLPNPYTQADFMANLPAGSTIEADGPDKSKICSSGGTCFRSFCRKEGELVGSLTRICFAASPNTSVEECIDFERTWDKWSEPTANLIATGNAIAEEQLEKLCSLEEKACDSLDLQDDALIKQCLLDDFWMNCADEPKLAETLNKEAQTLVLEGNVAAQYSVGQTITLKNAAGDICGSATVAAGEGFAVYNEETGNTTIKIEECELQEGKTPAVIKTAKPVLAATVGAVKAVVKQVKLLSIKKAAKAVPGKKETTPTRG